MRKRSVSAALREAHLLVLALAHAVVRAAEAGEMAWRTAERVRFDHPRGRGSDWGVQRLGMRAPRELSPRWGRGVHSIWWLRTDLEHLRDARRSLDLYSRAEGMRAAALPPRAASLGLQR